jgi:hypothetical protein
MSNDLIPISDEQAKLGVKALEVLQDVGGFLRQAVGTLPEDMVGVLGGDWFRYRRALNFVEFTKRVQENLRKAGVTNPQPVSLSLAEPIFKAAAQESRPELQGLWARLMANAMDPKRATIVRQEFIGTLRQLNPLDALVLDHITGNPPMDGDMVNHSGFPGQMKVSADEMSVSIGHLHRLGCIAQLLNPQGVEQQRPEFTTRLRLSAYARALMQACRA